MNGYMTVKEFCERYGKQQAVVSRMIKAGRIRAEKAGSQWLIPEDERPPEDRRFKRAE